MLGQFLERIAIALEEQVKVTKETYEFLKAYHSATERRPGTEEITPITEKVQSSVDETTPEIKCWKAGFTCTCNHPIETHGDVGCMVGDGKGHFCHCSAVTNINDWDTRGFTLEEPVTEEKVSNE